jgi:hypothetical protein
MKSLTLNINEQNFQIHEGIQFVELATTDYVKEHIEDYYIIINVTTPSKRNFDKIDLKKTHTFWEKQKMIPGSDIMLQTELDFSDDAAAKEFVEFFNFYIGRNQS